MTDVHLDKEVTIKWYAYGSRHFFKYFRNCGIWEIFSGNARSCREFLI